MITGIRKVAPIPIITTVPPATISGNSIRVPATVDLSGYPEYGTCHISRVVDLYLLLDYGEAGEPACVGRLGVGHGMGYVYGTVTPKTIRIASESFRSNNYQNADSFISYNLPMCCNSNNSVTAISAIACESSGFRLWIKCWYFRAAP